MKRKGFFQTKFRLDFFFKVSTMYLPKKRKKIVQKIAVLIITIQEILKSFSLALEIHYMRCFSDHFDCLLCWFKLTFTLMLHSVSLCDSKVDQMAERRQTIQMAPQNLQSERHSCWELDCQFKMYSSLLSISCGLAENHATKIDEEIRENKI